MKLFFSFFLCLAVQARPIIIIDFLPKEKENKSFLTDHIRTKYQIPEKYIQWKMVAECRRALGNSVLHLCLNEDLRVLNSKPQLLKKVIGGYIN